MKAMILAAGVGSRLDPLTSDLPKPLVPIANYAIIEHIIHLLKIHNFTNLSANLHYLANKIETQIGDGRKYGVNINFTTEENLTGDAGGLRSCKAFFQDETFLVINADLLTDFDLTYIINQHKAKQALASIALTKVIDVSQFGVALTNQDGFITGFQEKPKASEALSDLISTGIYVFEPAIFNYIPQSGSYGFGRDLFPKLLDLKLPLLGINVDGYWSDIGTIPKYCESNFDALNHKIQVNMSGTKIESFKDLNPQSAKFEYSPSASINGLALIGNNSIIEDNVELLGNVIIGPNTIIRAGVKIENSVIWGNNIIHSNKIIKNTIIGIREIACVI